MRKIAKKLLEEHQAFMDALVERGLLLDANALEASEYKQQDEDGKAIQMTSLSWGGASGLSYLFSEHPSISQYLESIRRRDFNFCLTDGSLIQIHYKIEGDAISYHRLCFHPCPFPYPIDAQDDLGLLDIPDLMSANELIQDIRLASPIRFDFDSRFSDEKHAHSHLTINRSTCRVPIFGPVSLGHFMRFIFRYFYETDFENRDWWPDVNPTVFVKTLPFPAPHEFHLASSADFD